MPQPRKYESNAARQKAYRDRVRARLAARTPAVGASTPGTQALVDRVTEADRRLAARDA